ncbi:hypothetical protein JSE7799_00494 [Jannaschia seosinensis]|uniref:Flp pilus assembly protein, pilin Flp n=1 Tax=Jannaschia seosinensis TaxID=313367 RepID=A0A0M7B958_9RHOB|nr:hypothetical protein [Jannaschia seosinensis]CUH19764.1 hypothetical protein JSE7799_00494 [Jannaschia seosinensis]
MSFVPEAVCRFAGNEKGAVTVEWVVLAGAVTGLGLAMSAVINEGFLSLSGTVDSELRGKKYATAGTTYTDGFDHGAGGWDNGRVSDIPGIGNVLGPLPRTGGAESTSRTFFTDPDAADVSFEFDMLGMDELEADDSSTIYINGAAVGSISVSGGHATFTASEGNAERNISVRTQNIDSGVNLGGGSAPDARTAVQVTIGNDGSGQVSIGFGSDTSTGADNESFAVDNFSALGIDDGLNNSSTETGAGA